MTSHRACLLSLSLSALVIPIFPLFPRAQRPCDCRKGYSDSESSEQSYIRERNSLDAEIEAEKKADTPSSLKRELTLHRKMIELMATFRSDFPDRAGDPAFRNKERHHKSEIGGLEAYISYNEEYSNLVPELKAARQAEQAESDKLPSLERQLTALRKMNALAAAYTSRHSEFDLRAQYAKDEKDAALLSSRVAFLKESRKLDAELKAAEQAQQTGTLPSLEQQLVLHRKMKDLYASHKTQNPGFMTDLEFRNWQAEKDGKIVKIENSVAFLREFNKLIPEFEAALQAEKNEIDKIPALERQLASYRKMREVTITAKNRDADVIIDQSYREWLAQNDQNIAGLEKRIQELRPVSFVMTVQETLKASVSSGLSVDGKWNTSTESGVRSFLQQLQQHADWGKGWTGQIDGIYSTSLAAHLLNRVNATDAWNRPTAAVNSIKQFLTALDQLKIAGIYTEPAPLPTPTPTPLPSPSPLVSQSLPASESIQSGDTGQGFFLALANGFLWEFGDEIYCKATSNDFAKCHAKAKEDIEQAIRENSVAVMVMNFIGVLFSFGGAIAIWLARSGHKVGASAFMIGFVAESIETVASMIGEVSTFGTLQDPATFIKFSLGACLVTGTVVWLQSLKK
jgi:hypothetical protein